MFDRNKISYSTEDLLNLVDKISRTDKQLLKNLIKMSRTVAIKDVPGSSLSIIINRAVLIDLSQLDEEFNQD